LKLNEIDISSFLALLVGGSGIGAWVLNFIQIRDLRRSQARGYIHQLAINPSFQKGLGSLLKCAALVVDITQASQNESFQLDEIVELEKEFKNNTSAEFFGSIFFLPKHLQLEILNLANSLQQTMAAVRDAIVQKRPIPVAPPSLGTQFDQISHELRKVFSIE